MAMQRHLQSLVYMLIFLAGVVFGLITRPDTEVSAITDSYEELQEKFTEMEKTCARPQTGEVTITGEDVIDAVKGKQLQFVVETDVDGN